MQVSKEIWNDKDLPLGLKIIYVEICSWPYGTIDNYEFINRNLKLNPEKVKRGLEALKEKKLVRTVNTKYGDRLIPADYYLTPSTVKALYELEMEINDHERSKDEGSVNTL